MSTANQALPPQVGMGHYLVVCAFCLAVILLIQLQAGLLLTNVFGVMIGALGLAYRLRLAPMLVVLLVAAAQLTRQVGGGYGDANPQRTMGLTDVILCTAVLGYVAGHFRLQAIWHNLLPTDVRQRAGASRRVFPWLKRKAPLLEEKRAAGQITPREIAWLVATLPVWAVIAQLAFALIPHHWKFLGLPARLVQMLVILWCLAVGFTVVRAFLNYLKHRSHDPATAQLYLQDLLWRDTRGEQRRVNRWLAWWQLKHRQDD